MAVSLASLASGADPTAPPAPSGTYGYLVPDGEPASAGECPIQPDVAPAQAGKRWATRSVRTVSGHLITAALATRGRGQLPLVWTGLSDAERTTLRAFLLEDVMGRGASFSVRPDGPGGSLVAVRLTQTPATVAAALGAHVVRLAAEESFVAA